MKEEIVKTVMNNHSMLSKNGEFVDVATKCISVGKWSGFRVFKNGAAYEIEMHDRNKFRFWHEIKEWLTNQRYLVGHGSL